MVFRIELTNSKSADSFDTKFFAALSSGFTLPPGLYEISDLNLMLRSSLLNGVEIKKYN